MKILIVEDDPTSTLVLERSLRKAGYETLSAPDGLAALDYLASHTIDAVVSDWMMPRMDGIELVRKIRETIQPPPVIVMVTALASSEARNHALSAGADDYLAKPFSIPEVLERLGNCLARRAQPEPKITPIAPVAIEGRTPPPFPVLAIAASTGGPEAVREVARSLGDIGRAAAFLVVHGPAWMLETFAARLQKETPLQVRLAEDQMPIEAGKLYLAPGEWHMIVDDTYTVRLNKDAPENYMRPAADPLFRSIAKVFHSASVGLILTGMGRDGTLGASEIAGAGGAVLAQDPRTAVAPSMPQTAINAGVVTEIQPLGHLAHAVRTRIEAARAVCAR